MKKQLFFVFGYTQSSWGEADGATWTDICGMIRIASKSSDAILEEVVVELKKMVKNKVLDKKEVSGGSGDLGGSWQKFFGTFMTYGDLSKQDQTYLMELNDKFDPKKVFQK